MTDVNGALNIALNIKDAINFKLIVFCLQYILFKKCNNEEKFTLFIRTFNILISKLKDIKINYKNYIFYYNIIILINLIYIDLLGSEQTIESIDISSIIELNYKLLESLENFDKTKTTENIIDNLYKISFDANTYEIIINKLSEKLKKI